MFCSTCSHDNDADAAFCVECGKSLVVMPRSSSARPRKTYFFIGVLLAALLAVGWFGYYKFFLPQGIAAVVNGEEIMLSDVDAVIVRMQGAGNAISDGIRYEVLNELIAERLVLQAARKENICLSSGELSAAEAESRAQSGLDEAAFTTEAIARYGSPAAYAQARERSLLIKKYIAHKVVPAGADMRSARMAVSTWVQDQAAKASIRIALAEQSGSAGCGNCGTVNSQPRKRGCGSSAGCAAGK